LKFKYLIIAFGIIIVIIISVAVFFPVLLSGNGQRNFSTGEASLRYILFPLLIFMVLLLGCMSIYFFINYRLFSLLEREDWPALAYYLENKIYVKGKFSAKNVRLLASSYLVISDFQSVLKLEAKTQLAKPSEISRNTLLFGSARILGGNYSEAAVFFQSNIEKCKPSDKQWVRWFYGFSELLSGSFRSAEPEFSSLAVSSNDVLITGLSAYFLHSSIQKKSADPEKCRGLSVSGKERVIASIKNIKNWNKEVSKAGTDIHIAIIRKYIEEARQWIFT